MVAVVNKRDSMITNLTRYTWPQGKAERADFDTVLTFFNIPDLAN